MKISKLLTRVLALATLTVGLSASSFSEGKDYVKLSNPIPNAQNTVIKVFSYDCPFCYKYDKSVTPAMVKALPSGVEYKVFHLSTKGKYGVQASKLFATAIAKDNAQGKSIMDKDSATYKVKMAYYKAYHDKKERWNGGEDAFLKTGFDASGLTKADYDSANSNPEVQNMLKAWDQSLEIAKIQGVPAFVVNGKYLVMTKSITSDRKSVV